ncbi:hypothetical protein [Streptomyces sp. KL116D]|uniref:hypothetical protein n=1 Tax=Streptomyces sp. KL116D TaxID=3045152 RepID=UPI003557F069
MLGKSVRGFMFWEEAYMYPGGRLYVEKDPLHDAQYTSWYSWATRWDDGTTEVGHFLLSGKSFGVGVVSSSLARSPLRNVTGRIDLTEDGAWRTGIHYDLDGTAWGASPMSWVAWGSGRCPTLSRRGIIQRVGRLESRGAHGLG